jgi:TPR repeat protein
VAERKAVLLQKRIRTRIMRWCAIVAISLHAVSGLAQQQPLSPVFKRAKPEKEVPTIEQSDATYQIWKAFVAARKAAAGDVLAQHELGLRYLLGKGVKADTAKGAYWIGEAAKQNLVVARFNLGILQYNGIGVTWNPFDAYGNFVYCAEKGMVEAEYLVGILHTENLIVPRNLESAVRWIRAAADSGYEPAQRALVQVENLRRSQQQSSGDSTRSASRADSLQMQPLFIDFAADTAGGLHDRYLLADALRSVDPEVLQAMGLPEKLDRDSPIDSATFTALSRSADWGSPEALTIVARCYDRGVVVRPDPVAAALWYIRALRMDSPHAPSLLERLVTGNSFADSLRSRADRNDPVAQTVWAALHALGFDGYLYSRRILITDTQALRLLEKASERGFPQANIELGLLSYAGKWVPHDPARALRYWTRASREHSHEADLRSAVVNVRSADDEEEVQRAIGVIGEAVQRGAVLAEVALAYCYETGTGVKRNIREAVRLYRNGAHRGSQDAFRALRRLYDDLRPGDPQFAIEEW